MRNELANKGMIPGEIVEFRMKSFPIPMLGTVIRTNPLLIRCAGVNVEEEQLL